MPEVAAKFQAKYNREWNMEDVQSMYQSFEKHLFASLQDFTTPIPHVIDTLSLLRAQGIKIGSTTGYTDKMMEIVLAGAREKGYTVDNLVTPDQVPAGRPYPYMIYKNMIDLAVPSVDEVVKVGDTITDIKEGLNAKVWTIGVISGSNDKEKIIQKLNITEEEYNQLSDAERDNRKQEVRQRMLDAGAHYVLDNITELPACIAQINQQLNK